MPDQTPRERASAGHKLGQLVGDWFERSFVLPMLEQVAARLQLYLDHRFQTRPVRGDRLVWRDADGNAVDYDFVMELNGSDDTLGVPVAFLESFWRRGKRHSKDKARDDSGKLLPMRETHPTARFLGIIAGGDFTVPARELVKSRGIDLFYVPKDKIVAAFDALGLQMDYPDRSAEEIKRQLVDSFDARLTDETRRGAADKLRDLIGPASITTYVSRVHSALGALPQEIRLLSRRNSAACVFERVSDATEFLAAPQFDFTSPRESYVYEITYSDGSEFSREVGSLEDLRELHERIQLLTDHLNALQT
ncbi:MAG TPA: hypothetical protein VML55_07195 [Planctomycetaceae bacterium]|nr:hypothetical protein [Planctomycetaceae bacterium]